MHFTAYNSNCSAIFFIFSWKWIIFVVFEYCMKTFDAMSDAHILGFRWTSSTSVSLTWPINTDHRNRSRSLYCCEYFSSFSRSNWNRGKCWCTWVILYLGFQQHLHIFWVSPSQACFRLAKIRFRFLLFSFEYKGCRKKPMHSSQSRSTTASDSGGSLSVSSSVGNRYRF